MRDRFRSFRVAEIFKRTPYIADLKPAGKYVAKDITSGGVPLLMKTLLDHGFLHGDCLTVTGRTVNDNLRKVVWNLIRMLFGRRQAITATAVSSDSGESRARGAIVKVAGMPEAD